MQFINLTQLLALLLLIFVSACQCYYIVRDAPVFEDQIIQNVKKSQLRSLAGSRNCYFSPINCVITQDLSKLRKLAGSH